MLFVRSISQYESQQLYQLVRKSPNVITIKRVEIIIASSKGMAVTEIARLYHCSQEHIRQVIRKFNKEGLKALYPKRGGGRLKQISPEQEAYILEMALTPPKVLGLPFTQWSLSKLRSELIKRKIVKDISREAIRKNDYTF